MANYPYPFNENVNNKYLCSDGAWKVIEDPEFLTEITYSELKQLRDNSLLVPGMKYKITDYVTTTTQSDTKSAGHAFDIVTEAVSENQLSEDCKAVLHDYSDDPPLYLWEKYDATYQEYSSETDEPYQRAYIITDTLYQPGSISFNNPILPLAYISTPDGEEGYDSINPSFDNDYFVEATLNNITCPNAVDVGDGKELRLYKTNEEYMESEEVDTGDWYTYIGELDIASNDYFKDANIDAWEIKYTLDNIRWSLQSGIFATAEEGEYVFKKQGTVEIESTTYVLWKGNSNFVDDYDLEYVVTEDEEIGSSVYPYNNEEVFDEIFVIEAVNTVTEEGKGTIYYMKDEFNNECPYDFKNIRFKRWKVADTETGRNGLHNLYMGVLGNTSQGLEIHDESDFIWAYTFSSDASGGAQTGGRTQTDFSLGGNGVHSNVFKEMNDGTLPNNVLYGGYNFSNSFGNNCRYNTFGNDCIENTFGNDCTNNTFGNGCYRNFFGNYCYRNSFGYGCYSNSFGNECGDNSLGGNCYRNTFGNYCIENTFGSYCEVNSFGNDCLGNTFGNNCYDNYFGSYCHDNSFGNNGQDNSFGEGCQDNTFVNDCKRNSFGNNCTENSFGNYCESNSFGNYCHDNSFRDSCSYNSFGNQCAFNSFRYSCSYNSFGNHCRSINFSKDYMWYNIVENGNMYITVTSTQTTSSSNKLQNFTISQGYNNTTTKKTISHNTVNDTFQTLYPGLVQEITYSSLVSLIAANGLTPGKKYRITDYATTTVQTGTQSAGHGFDVVVTALSRNELDENARAMKRSGDTYFANCNLDAWEIKYRLENDTTNFAWADSTNGKGVIYYMKDEWDNEAPYDFKNILFARYWITADTSTSSLASTWLGCYDLNNTTKVPSTATFDSTPKYMYTFTKLDDMISTATVSDYSVVLGSDSKSYCYGNKIGLRPYGSDANNKFYLNNIVFFATSTTPGMYRNTFGNDCYSNSFGDECFSNSFGNGCYSNSFGNACYYNSFGNDCYRNSFGNFCYSNSFGNGCTNNTFGNDCYSNTFGNSCYRNTFGNNCRYNTFGNECTRNTFGNYCDSDTFGNYCSYNTFGNSCSSDTFGNYCSSNTFGNNCDSNTFGEGCNHITFQKDYTWYVILENGNRYITVTSTQTTSSSNVLRNFTISQGVNNTFTTTTISHNTVNDTFRTTYQPSNSEVVNV